MSRSRGVFFLYAFERSEFDFLSYSFIDRYIPGYVFFGDGVTKGFEDDKGVTHPPRWLGSGLKVSIDENRELVSTEYF